MKKLVIGSVVVLALAAITLFAADVTNRGRTFTVGLMSEMTQSTAVDTKTDWLVGDTAVWVVDVVVPADGLSTAAHEFGIEMPKGMILLEDAVIEVTSAVLPTNSTIAIAIGGVTVATAANLTAGVKTAVATPAATTAAGKLTVTVATAAATDGAFTVYLPVLAGKEFE